MREIAYLVKESAYWPEYEHMKIVCFVHPIENKNYLCNRCLLSGYPIFQEEDVVYYSTKIHSIISHNPLIIQVRGISLLEK